jgi:hypothetical protein
MINTKISELRQFAKDNNIFVYGDARKRETFEVAVENWNKYTSLTIGEILIVLEEIEACKEAVDFVKQFDTVNELIPNVPDEYWTFLLRRRPEFAHLCDWNKLQGYHLVSVLEECPDLLPFCDLSKLTGFDWRCLLVESPSFSQYCDWDLLGGYDWSSLIVCKPAFADLCDWSKLNGRCWAYLLLNRPEFAQHCDWSKLDDSDWELLLKYQPQFKDV